MVSGPLAVEDIELVMPSKKSLEAGSLVGDPGARERGARLVYISIVIFRVYYVFII